MKGFTEIEIDLKFTSMTSEEKIQYIFHCQNKPNEEKIQSIIHLLNHDPSPIVRHEAAYTLGELNFKKCIPALIKAIENDENRIVIHESSLALANRGDEIGYNVIKKLLHHHDQDVADTAIISLQRLDNKTGRAHYPSELSSEDVILDLNQSMENRIQAAFKLMDVASDQTVHTLVKALQQESNAIVKHEIIFCLGETASRIAYEALAKLVFQENINDFVLHEAILALSTLSYKGTAEIIEQFLDHPVAEIAESAEIALERYLN